MKIRTLTLYAVGLAGMLLPGCAGDDVADRTVIGKTQQALFSGIQFGTRCQQDYQNGWQVDVGDTWDRCSKFVSQASSLGGVGNFYYNLHGAKAGFENPDTCGWSCGYVDSVDFFYTTTHGAVTSQAALYAMWDQNSLAATSVMRLGASGRQNMVFSAFGCSGLQIDSLMWTRWSHTFSGGLVLATSGHGLMWSGNTQSSTDYVNRMNNNEAIGTAWLESSWYADNSNTPAVAATGTDSANCSARLGINKNNLLATWPLRDSAIGWFCYESWN